MAILGIDLGTTNSLVGVVDAGFPILLADSEGQRLTPSAVYYPENGDPPVVGRAALRQRLVHPARTVTSVKRLMGKRAGELDLATFPYPITGEPGQPIQLDLPWADNRVLTPEYVSSHILAHLSNIATEAMGETIDRAIITVPAYFNDAQRQATKRAGELAGLRVERILNEPTAAALSFGLHKSEERSHIVVYDFGGGTFDVSILEIRDGVFHVLATHGDSFLGGDDIDYAFAEALWHRYAPDRGALDGQEIRLRLQFGEAAARAKIALSSVMEIEVNLPFVEDQNSFTCRWTRGELEKLARPIVERTRRHCKQALQDAGLALDKLDHVLLVGGTTRMPLVRELAADIFQQAPNTSEHPDESIALGAVIQGGILSGDLRNMVLLDVTPLSLGIESFGGLMNVIIPRNSTIPTKAGELFTNAVSDQSSMLIRVLQGEREMARDNWELGRVEIPFTKGPKGSARVGVQFQIDENGILEVLARDTQESRDVVLRIQNAAVDVDDIEVEKMISQSVDHAFEDMNERVLTEEKLKSEELLLAVDQALETIGTALDVAEREAILASSKEVKAALDAGEVARLKAANRSLDDATQVLAALLMERAMEAAMEKRGLM